VVTMGNTNDKKYKTRELHVIHKKTMRDGYLYLIIIEFIMNYNMI
jgi:hypothetical protein